MNQDTPDTQEHYIARQLLSTLWMLPDYIPLAAQILSHDGLLLPTAEYVWQVVKGHVSNGKLDYARALEAIHRKSDAAEFFRQAQEENYSPKRYSERQITEWASALAELGLRRLGAGIAEKTRNAMNSSAPLDETVSTAMQELAGLRSRGGMNTWRSQDDIMVDSLKILEAMERGVVADGVMTGFPSIDFVLSGGFPNGELILLGAKPSMGKCLGKGTPVMMYDGTVKKVEDVRVGDTLMGDDSLPRRVLSLARGREMMYWVRQKKGMDYRVNESHILTLRKSRQVGGDGNSRGHVIDISVRDYLAKHKTFHTSYKGFKVAAEFKEQPVPIDPYLLGLWLGDGGEADSRIHNPDSEIIEWLRQYAESAGQKVNTYQYKEGGCPVHTIAVGNYGRGSSREEQGRGFYRKLRLSGLLGNKHIPQEYISNSREVRLQLLAGLIDTDGYISDCSGNNYEIVQTREALARQIKYLCDTLGYRVSIRKKKATIKSVGYEGIVWRVTFNGNVDEIPVRVSYKKSPPWTCHRNWQNTGVEVERDCEDEYFGFTLDGNGRFLLEDGTVTHNTAASLELAMNMGFQWEKEGSDKCVAYFSAETTSSKLQLRMACSLAKVNQAKLRAGRATYEEKQALRDALERVRTLPIYIDEGVRPTTQQMLLRAMALDNVAVGGKQKRIGIIFFDFLELAGDEDANEVMRVGKIANGLKDLAKTLNVPVVALSQVGKAVDGRMPTLNDLRWSATLEQLPYIIMFIHRESYYKKRKELDYSPLFDDDAGKAVFMIAKHKDGATGPVEMRFEEEYAKFSDPRAKDGW